MTFHRGWSEEYDQGLGVLDIRALDEYDEEEEKWEEDDVDEEWDEDSEEWDDEEDSEEWDDEDDEDWDELDDDDDDDVEARRGGHLNWN